MSSTAALAVALAGVAAAGTAVDRSTPPPRLPPAASAAAAEVTVAGSLLRPLDGAAALQGPARAQGITVSSVPADEGFWVGTGDRRVWVQLVGEGESSVAVRAGDRVSFEGRAVPVPPGFAAQVGLTQAEGAGELERTGVLVQVPHDRLVVR